MVTKTRINFSISRSITNSCLSRFPLSRITSFFLFRPSDHSTSSHTFFFLAPPLPVSSMCSYFLCLAAHAIAVLNTRCHLYTQLFDRDSLIQSLSALVTFWGREISQIAGQNLRILAESLFCCSKFYFPHLCILPKAVQF